MENQFCTKCGAKAEGDSLFCTQCGAKLEKKLFCQKCGVEVKPSSIFCHACGTALNKAPENAPRVTTNVQPANKPSVATANEQSVEKAPKSPTQKQENPEPQISVRGPLVKSKSDSTPIGKSRTKSRKIADWLMFVATMVLILMPFITISRIDHIFNPGSYSFGGGYFLFFIRSTTAMVSTLFTDDLPSLYIMLLKYMSIIISAFFIIYIFVHMIISLPAIVLSIIRAAKGQSWKIAHKISRLITGYLVIGFFFTLFSTPYISYRYSLIMQFTLLFALLLISVSILICSIGNKQFLFKDKAKASHYIKDIFFLLSGLCVFLLGMFLPISDCTSNILLGWDALFDGTGEIFMSVYTAFSHMVIFILTICLIAPAADQVKNAIFKLTYDRQVSRKEKMRLNTKCYTHPIAQCIISAVLAVINAVNIILGVGNYLFLIISILIFIFCLLTSVGTIICSKKSKNPNGKPAK